MWTSSSVKIPSTCLLLALVALSHLSSSLGQLESGVMDPSLAQVATSGSAMIVNMDRLESQIEQLASLSSSPAPGVTRVLFTDKDMAARRYIYSLMVQANLTVRDDAIGNIFGRWEGTEPGVVGTGSHTDAIPNSGKYDGVLGVLGAIEAIHALKSTGFQPKKSIEVIMFTSEEPTRFGISCLGSRVMVGAGNIAETLVHLRDAANISFAEAAAKGMHPDALKNLGEVRLKSGAYSAFVELHIEQGPILEEEGYNVGIVTAIAAPAAFKVDFYGHGGHAGGQLMPFRNDAGLAGAELALAIEKHVLASGSNDTVGTTGVFEVQPNAINSVPTRAHLEIDIRDIDAARRDAVIEKVKASAKAIAETRKVNHTFEMVNQDPPAVCSDWITKAIGDAAQTLALKARPMPSRAYHDSLFMSRIAPTGMIFVPCYKGYSHRPDEFVSREDMLNGISTLALTLSKLSTEDPSPKKKGGWFW